MTTDNENIVLGFIAQFENGWPPDIDAAMAPLAEDASYQMVVPTFEPVRGRAAIVEAIENMTKKVDDQKHDMLNVATAGNVVFTERCDYSLRGGNWVPIPLVAVFEVNGEGKISAWREYLDVYNNMKQHGHSFEEMEKTIGGD
jgi:limonene-1,2-epoxide hydrolase